MDGSPIIICGMHRSGTSLVAGLLSGCGLFVSPEDLLMERQDDNPTGFYENHEIVNMHESALVRAGYGWDDPPAAGSTAAESLRSPALIEDARIVLARYQGQDFWGFKDPRVSLFMDFWRSLLPGARFLVCIRNPLDVALSLHRRANCSIGMGLRLWQNYFEYIEAAFDSDRDMVVHFDSLRRDPGGELSRLLAEMGRDVPQARLEQTMTLIRPGTPGNGFSLLAARAHGLSEEGAELYTRFLNRAGPGGDILSGQEPLAALGMGFEPGKDKGVWMGREGKILVDTSNVSGNLLMSFNVRTTLLGGTPSGKLSLSLSLNGVDGPTVTVSHDKTEQILLGLSNTGEKFSTLTLHSSFATSPCSAGIGSDPRILSVNVGGLKVVEQPAAPPQK